MTQTATTATTKRPTSEPRPPACICSDSPLARRTLQLIKQSRASIHYMDAHAVFIAAQGQKLIEKVLVFDQVSQAHTRVSTDSGYFPPNTDIKRCGANNGTRWALGFLHPATHRLILPRAAQTKGETEEDADEIREVRLPALIFFGRGRKYHIWALATRDFDPHATLHHAPLPNVYDDGKICWGNNTAPEVGERYLDEALSIFRRSPYTTNEIQGKSRRHPKDIRLMLEEQARKGAKAVYPLRDLVPFKLTLDEALDYLIDGQDIPNQRRK